MKWSRARPRVGGSVFALLALSLALFAFPADAGNLDKSLERLMKKARVPGAATAIVVGDEIVQSAGYGLADPELGTPVTPDTLFAIASVAKPVTATLAMRLVDRKRLDLDANVNDYLGFEVRNPHFPADPITLRQLLTHTSSISDRAFYARIDEMRTFGTDWPGSLSQFLIDYLTPGGRYYDPESSWVEAAPGSRATGYSNVGYALVNHLVESAGGGSLQEVSRKLLFDPLGMPGASWRLSETELDDLAVPCAWTAGGFVPYPHLDLSVGLLRTSATELADFARLHLAQGRFDGRRILKPKTAAEMVELQYRAADVDLGLGFDLILDDGAWIAHHGGGVEGTITWLWLDLNKGYGVVLLANGESWAHGRRALRAFFKMRARLIQRAEKLADRTAGK